MTEEISAGRIDAQEWSLLPWLTAGFGAVAGLIFFLLVDEQGTIAIWRQSAATFVGVGALSLLITLDRVRPHWSALFALFWGAVIALVGWFTASYNFDGELVEMPFLSGLAAVAVAAPLFQAARDEGARRFPPARIHHHVWTDATIVGVGMLFTGLTFFTAFMIATLFGVIGIDALKDLMEEGEFNMALAGFAFGGAVGLLRTREKLTATVRKLAMVVLVLIAPVLAFALWSFLVLLPVTGLDNFWDSGVPPTPILLLGAFGAFALGNIIAGDGEGDDDVKSPLLKTSGQMLTAAILPLALLAALSMGQRIGQYGWTPERLWGVIAIAIAIAQGAIGWWSLVKGRRAYGEVLRPLQVRLALGVCALTLFLALPILDFGRISAGSQLARLERGEIKPTEFDWAAMAFDFGPAGRKALERLKQAGGEPARLATEALAKDRRYEASELTTEIASRDALPKKVRLMSPDIAWSDDLAKRVERVGGCGDKQACQLYRLAPDRLLLARQVDEAAITTDVIDLSEPLDRPDLASERQVKEDAPALATGQAEIRAVPRRQLFVDGKPVGDTFE